METKVVYQTDALGIYMGEAIADRSPLEDGVWLIPGGCVEIAPPVVPAFKAARWLGNKWQLIDSYQGLTAYNVQTREPMVVDRAGPIPVGYTLEVPSAGQVWDGKHWVDDVPAVIELRFVAQMTTINQACTQQITGGFWSEAVGMRHFYDSELQDQLNLTGMILRGTDGFLPCADEAGTKVFLEHTLAQLRQVGDEFTELKLQLLRKANALKAALAAARAAGDLDALNAVAWGADAV
jgi:hypothetical protein